MSYHSLHCAKTSDSEIKEKFNLPHSSGILRQSGQSNILEFLADVYVQENQEEGLALKPEAGVTFEVCS